MSGPSALSPERIAAAADAIDPVFTGTPQLLLERSSAELGFPLHVKVETLNPIRSFKGRGTEWFLETQDELSPLVCASAGNFGQGLAWGCRARGIPLTVFAAEGANPLKVRRMRELGAEVRLAGADFDAAKDAARAHAAASGLRFVEDGREPAIAEGAGTIAVELCRGREPVDVVLVPLGNGALINGISRWMKARAPGIQVIGVCAESAPAMALSWRAGRAIRTASADTIADGIAVRVPVPEALEEMRGRVDDVLLVGDEDTRRAMRRVFDEIGLVTEPAGAIGVAAARVFRERFRGLRVATPLCGGNLSDPSMLLRPGSGEGSLP